MGDESLKHTGRPGGGTCWHARGARSTGHIASAAGRPEQGGRRRAAENAVAAAEESSAGVIAAVHAGHVHGRNWHKVVHAT